jgi:exopolysaccharide production protein ExoZ
MPSGLPVLKRSGPIRTRPKSAHDSLRSLQAYRAIAAVLVMLFHCNVISSDPRYFSSTPAPFFLAGAAGVPFFFVLSGYIIARSHPTSRNGPREAWNFLVKRVLRLYPMLWIVLACVVVGLIIQTHQMQDPWYLLQSLLAIPTNQAPPLAVEWTLQHEMLFYCSYGLLLAIPILRIPLLAALGLSAIAGLFVQTYSYPLSFFTDPSHLLFVLGVVLVAFERKLSERRALLIFVFGCGLFVINYLLTLARGVTLLPPEVEWPYGLASAMIIYASARLEEATRLVIAPWLVKLGDASYVLYLIHFPILSVGMKCFTMLNQHVRVPSIIAYCVLPFIAIAVSIFVHERIERAVLAPLTKQFSKRMSLPTK